MNRYDVVIFDLDGTLLDTLSDLTASTNAALAAHGFPERTQEQVRLSVGNGVARLIERSVPAGTSEEECASVLSDFKAHYLNNVNVHTRPYSGVKDMLRAIHWAGVRVAVNSNKVDSAVQALCRAHFVGVVDMALGERLYLDKKPSPQGVRLILNWLGAKDARVLYVGDGDTDILTAKNAGIDCAWVSWGFRRREELDGVDIPLAFDTPEALWGFILGR